MSVRDQELFEAIAGDLLSELGYERAQKTVGSNIAAVAQQCEARWRAEMQRRREQEARRHRRPSPVVPQRS